MTDERVERLEVILHHLKAIDVGQSAEPDHWRYRQNARIEAQTAMAHAHALLARLRDEGET